VAARSPSLAFFRERRISASRAEKTVGFAADFIDIHQLFSVSLYLDKPNFLPDRSFAEAYLKLKSGRNAKELGDICLFLTGVFPKYGSKYNIDTSYYVGIASSSYDLAARTLNYETFKLLSIHFEYIRQFIELTTNSNKNLSILSYKSGNKHS
jgi:hypothetical protein